MVLYKDKPNLKLKKVVTNTGETEYYKNCKKFDNVFYRKSDCVLIGTVAYPKDHPGVEKDWETNRFFLKNSGVRVMKGIVAIENDTIKYGYFTPNLNNNIPCYNEQTNIRETILNLDVIKDCKHFVENVSEGIIHYNPKMSDNARKNYKKIHNCYDWTVKKYNIEDNASEYKKKSMLYQNFNHEEKIGISNYAKYLNHTFGYEFEVARGFIPDYMQNRHGLVICRDGSIDAGGPEFVTVPLEGSKGLASLIQLCSFAKDRVFLDMSCSTHLHLGGFSREKKFLVALHILCYAIQDDMFAMLPPYKKYWEGYKKKNYCKFLDRLVNKNLTSVNVDEYYAALFSFLADFRISINEFKPGMKHPSGHKWDIENRKYWINLVNMVFSDRYTIEFRAHQATFNPTKVVNWLFINNAILSYAQTYADEIIGLGEKISLKDVLLYYKEVNPGEEHAEFLSNYLVAYYEHCVEKFKKAFDNKDYTCDWDLKEDAYYDFQVDGKNLLM